MVRLKNVAVCLAAAIMPAVSAAHSAGDDTPGRYIVTLKRDLSEDAVSKHLDYTRDVHKRSLARRDEDLSIHSWSHGIEHHLKVRDFRGYAGQFDRRTIEEIKRHEAVADVEEDMTVHTWEVKEQKLAPWNLGALSYNTTIFNPVGSYSYDSSGGKGTWTYVIDTSKSVL